ncbi:MAG TPA: HNH endonuclease signature motif containing protein [Candidatus Nanoarchaeia archaeon]|nr:HNH endonuclease signature motif containing protein [Candidatus Nanoarchaeia archaeon]
MCSQCRRLECQCRRQRDRARGTSTERGYDANWQRFRNWFLQRHPVCECKAKCGRPATEVHHVVRLSDGGDRLHESNCQALTHSCHSKLRGEGGWA